MWAALGDGHFTLLHQEMRPIGYGGRLTLQSAVPVAAGLSLAASESIAIHAMPGDWQSGRRLRAIAVESGGSGMIEGLVVDSEYTRRKIHEMFGGQTQGGISTPAQHPVILLFTGKSGARFGYLDRRTEDGIYLYTGEGQKGSMTFTKGNLALRDHAQDGKDVLLFEQTRRGSVRYLGQRSLRVTKHRGPLIETERPET